MKEFEGKIKIIFPELKDENNYKLFLSLLAITSSGTNPNQKISYKKFDFFEHITFFRTIQRLR
jgi:hypothetical protein